MYCISKDDIIKTERGRGMIAVKFMVCRDDKASRHNAGRQLLSDMLQSLCGIDRPDIKYTKNGKPYAENAVFSISHSGEIAVCALRTDIKKEDCLYFEGSPDSIGIDIEIFKEDKERYQKIAERYFSEEEIKCLEDSENYSLEFLRLWTKKEAHIKCTGEGLKDIRKPLPDGIITKVLNIKNKTVILSICTK